MFNALDGIGAKYPKLAALRKQLFFGWIILPTLLLLHAIKDIHDNAASDGLRLSIMKAATSAGRRFVGSS
jgi:hypothetical protein